MNIVLSAIYIAAIAFFLSCPIYDDLFNFNPYHYFILYVIL